MLTPRLTRRRLAGFALVALIALAGWAWWLLSAGRINKANFDLVETNRSLGIVGGGMTLEQIESILGPHGFDTELENDKPGYPMHVYYWESSAGLIQIFFYRGRAESARWHPYHYTLIQRAKMAWWRTFRRDPPF
jgi:hypothetical protein